jgi:non-specific serine/threonine protein kinase
VLTDICAWFSEGFDTADLKEAKALLASCDRESDHMRIRAAGRKEGTQLAPGPSRGYFQRESNYWRIGLEGDATRLRDVKGLRYISHLLRNPGVEIHAAELAGIARDDQSRRIALGDAGEVLDAKARQSYQRRLEDLREELGEAERWSDVGRMEKTRAEIGKAIGLGGRSRRASSDAERARLMVTQRIKSALRAITAASPAIGQHLSRSIRTGIFCCYELDRSAAIDWEL